MAAIARACRLLTRLGECAGALAMWLVVAVVVYDVLARAAGHPTLWALEVSTYLLVAVSVLAAGETLHRDGHFQVTIIVDLLPDRVKSWLTVIVDALSCLFVAALAYGCVQLLGQTYAFGFRSPTLLHVPLIYPQGVFSVGIFLLLLAYLARLAGRIRTLLVTPSC